MNLIAQGPSIIAAQAQELARLAGSTTIERIAEHAWRIGKAAPADAIAPYCERERIDYAFIPEGRRFADLKLLAMDMDSTLITIECIDEIAGVRSVRVRQRIGRLEPALPARTGRRAAELQHAIGERVDTVPDDAGQVLVAGKPERARVAQQPDGAIALQLGIPVRVEIDERPP